VSAPGGAPGGAGAGGAPASARLAKISSSLSTSGIVLSSPFQLTPTLTPTPPHHQTHDMGIGGHRLVWQSQQFGSLDIEHGLTSRFVRLGSAEPPAEQDGRTPVMVRQQSRSRPTSTFARTSPPVYTSEFEVPRRRYKRSGPVAFPARLRNAATVAECRNLVANVRGQA
jgi:hypothetical protein